MATMTTSEVQLSALPPTGGRAGMRGVLASEFTKLRSVRSTYWTVAALLILGIGLAAAIAAGTLADLHAHPGDKAGFDATQVSLGAFFELGQLVIAVLGAMAITSEYSTGMIRTSLTAMPRRGTVYASKLLVFTVSALVISLVTAFLAFFVGQAVLSGSGVSASLFHSTTVPMVAQVTPNGAHLSGSYLVTSGAVLGAVVGAALFVTAAAVIAFGLGAIIRHTAGAIASAIGLLFVLPIIIQLLPSTWRFDLVRFFPSAAGQVLTTTVGATNQHMWSAWPQFAVTAIWAVALVAAGAYLFRKRDA